MSYQRLTKFVYNFLRNGMLSKRTQRRERFTMTHRPQTTFSPSNLLSALIFKADGTKSRIRHVVRRPDRRVRNTWAGRPLEKHILTRATGHAGGPDTRYSTLNSIPYTHESKAYRRYTLYGRHTTLSRSIFLAYTNIRTRTLCRILAAD